MSKALVLSSGGVDSTTCIAIAIQHNGKENVSTVSFKYGQKHDKELQCAENIAEFFGVKHYVLDIAAIMKYSNCPLLQHSSEKIEHKSYREQIEENGEGMVSTYVPFRNGLMLSAAAALAVSLFPDENVELYLGAHADDAAGSAYADCSLAFVESMGRAISIGTYGKVQAVAPLVRMNKAEVVACGLAIQEDKDGNALRVPYELTWSCYEGSDVPCGTCGTCIDRANAFASNNIPDPALN